jgi:hypothetical protein
VGLFRREKLHERLAREGGLEPEIDRLDPVDTTPALSLPGIHGVARPRRWDAVVTAHAPGLDGDARTFVVLPDGSLILREDTPAEAVEPLAAELDAVLPPPYRVEAVRRSGDVWAAAARRIEVVELPDLDGDQLQLTVQDGSRALVVDGMPSFGSARALERIAGERFDSYVASADRLEGDLWEVGISPL